MASHCAWLSRSRTWISERMHVGRCSPSIFGGMRPEACSAASRWRGPRACLPAEAPLARARAGQQVGVCAQVGGALLPPSGAVTAPTAYFPLSNYSTAAWPVPQWCAPSRAAATPALPACTAAPPPGAAGAALAAARPASKRAVQRLVHAERRPLLRAGCRQAGRRHKAVTGLAGSARASCPD
jgi:hypothetical protein